MAKQIIYLSLPVILEVTENVLATHPEHYKQKVLTIPRFYQRLSVYIIKQVSDFYTIAIEDAQNPSNIYFSSEQELHFKELVKKSIYHLIQENSTNVSYVISQDINTKQVQKMFEENGDKIANL